MSSASTGRYQSRLLNFLIEKSQQLSDRMGQAARQVKTTTIWSLQLLMYPMYAMFQTGRLAGKQMQQAASQKLRRLQGSSKKRSPVRQKTSQPQKTVSTTTIETTDNRKLDLPLPPLTEKADDSPLVRAFQKSIHWMETGTVAVKVNLFKESKLVESLLPPTPSPSGESDLQKIAIESGSPSSPADKPEDLSFLKAVDRTVAQLEAGQFPEWQGIGNDLVAGTRSLWEPVKNWYMWQGDDLLELEDDELTRDLWAEPSGRSPVSPASPAKSKRLILQLPGKALPQLVQKSEAVIGTTIAEWFGKVRALVHPAKANTSVAQITGDRPANFPRSPQNPLGVGTGVGTGIGTGVGTGALPLQPDRNTNGQQQTVSHPLEQQAFSAMAAELAAVPEANNNPNNNIVSQSFVHQGWDLLRSKAGTIKETLAISPVAKSSQSLATVATAATATIQKVGETVGQSVVDKVVDKIGAIAHSPVGSDAITPTQDTTSTMTETETPATGMGEPETGRDYIETKAVSAGYIKHPLQMVLEGIDRAMLWLEKMAMRLFKWWQAFKQELMG